MIRNLTLRKITPDDIDDITYIMMSESNIHGDSWTDETARAHIEYESGHSDLCYCACIDQDVVWFVYADYTYMETGKEIYIDLFYIRENYQNNGIGKSLLWKIQEMARAEWVVKVRLLANVNRKSYGRYEKHRFVESHRHEMEIDIEDLEL